MDSPTTKTTIQQLYYCYTRTRTHLFSYSHLHTMSYTTTCNYVTLSSPSVQGLDLPLAMPSPSERRARKQRSLGLTSEQMIVDSDDEQTLTGYETIDEKKASMEVSLTLEPSEHSTPNLTTTNTTHQAAPAYDDDHFHALNEEHLAQLRQQRRQEEIKASWLDNTGVDVTDQRNGPLPECTVEELISAMDNFFGASAKKPQRINKIKVAEKVSGKRKGETTEASKAHKSRKASFVEKCKGVKWMA